MLWLAYAAGLLALCTAAVARELSYGQWLMSGFDWVTALGSIATAMLGGALRTMVTLLSKAPTFRVAVQGLVDAVVSALAGIPIFVGLQVWAAYYPPPGHDVRFALLFAAGMVGRTLFKRLDQGLKDGMDIAVQGAKAKLAARLGLPPPAPLLPDESEMPRQAMQPEGDRP